MKIPKKDYNYITYLKTVCVILVVLGHSMLFFDDNPFFLERSPNPFVQITYVFRIFDNALVNSYTLCAGFLFSRSLVRHQRSIKDIIVGRAKRLLVPYYIYGALWVVPLYTYFDIKTFGRPEHAGYLEGYKCMLLGQFSDHLWFLWMLFWVSLIFTLMSPLIRKRKMGIVFVITLACALIVSFFLADFPYFKLSQIAPYLLCYYAGILVHLHETSLESHSPARLMLYSSVGFVIMMAYVIFCPSYNLISYIVKPAGALFMLFAFMASRNTMFWKKFETTNTYRFLSVYNMDIYLVNLPFTYLYFRLFDPHLQFHPFLCTGIVFIHSIMSIFAVLQVKIAIKSAFFKLFSRRSE